MEAVIANDVYNTTGYNTKQHLEISKMSDGYTSIVWDMIDDVNQGGSLSQFPNDNVEGYTLSQIEYALELEPIWWNGWRDMIKVLFVNPTEEHVDYLFRTYY